MPLRRTYVLYVRTQVQTKSDSGVILPQKYLLAYINILPTIHKATYMDMVCKSMYVPFYV